MLNYAELHCKTNFSFLEGASHADELVAAARELGYEALAVTDLNTLAGVVRAHTAAQDAGLKLIIGAEITPADAPPVVLWASDRASYGRLSRLLTVGRRRAEKGECKLWLEDVAAHSEGLIAGVSVKGEAKHEGQSTKDERGEQGIFTRLRHPNNSSFILRTSYLERYREIFKDACYLLAELHRGPDDARQLEELITLSNETNVPLVAAGDVHYHSPGRMALQHVLTAIREGTTVDQLGEHLLPNAQRHLRSLEEISEIYSRVPEAVARTVEVADRCTFSLDELRYEYPEELAPPGETPMQFLSRLSWEGAARRYPTGLPDKIRRMLKHELELIEQLHYEAYFLTVWDVVRFARSRNILCQGRGSAANSVVCYCLEVTSVDPDRVDLLFERFVSRERDEAPDIDVDFEHARREEVLQYIYSKYGRERAGMTAVVTTYRSRSAVRDVGKALDLSLDRVDALAKQVEGYSREPQLAERCAAVGIDPNSKVGKQLIYFVNDLIGFPRHLSQHVGGMVMTQGPLCELVPIENAAMDDRTVIQWDKDDLDALGILKVDCLCLGMLTAIHKCFDLIEGVRDDDSMFPPPSSLDPHPLPLTLANIPKEDPAVYDMICEADTIGVFQIESRAQMSMLPRLRPRKFYDLVIEVAIVRPGPIQGNMVHPYLRRRAGEEEATYPNEEIEQVLHKTLGVPIFQEQAMRLAVVAAGFTPGEADQLRRAMGAWRRPGIIDQFRKKLIDGMNKRGLSDEFAENVFNQIRGFGEYGFPESHAASFALLVYASAWLKHYYPAAFCAAIINSQPMGFYAPAQLVQDAKNHSVEVLPVDVNESEWDCTLEGRSTKDEGRSEGRSEGRGTRGEEVTTHPSSLDPRSSPTLRLGFRMIVGFSEKDAEAITRAREDRPFTSVADFTRRTKLGRTVVSRLARADAFGSLHNTQSQTGRRQAIWEALSQEKQAKQMPLLDNLQEEDDAPLALPTMELEEEVLADYATTGLSLKAHPLSFYREQLKETGVAAAEDLFDIANNTRVCVAGIVLLRQRPSTAKGITFVTIEDETGTANLVVHQKTWEKFYTIARRATGFFVHGRLERKGKVIHVIVERLEDLSTRLRQLAELSAKSRDFR